MSFVADGHDTARLGDSLLARMLAPRLTGERWRSLPRLCRLRWSAFDFLSRIRRGCWAGRSERRIRTEPLLRLASALEDLEDTRLERLNGRDVVGEAVERAYVVVSASSLARSIHRGLARQMRLDEPRGAETSPALAVQVAERFKTWCRARRPLLVELRRALPQRVWERAERTVCPVEELTHRGHPTRQRG